MSEQGKVPVGSLSSLSRGKRVESRGSSFELGIQLLIAKHRNNINNETLKKIEEKIEEFQKMTMGFQNSLN